MLAFLSKESMTLKIISRTIDALHQPFISNRKNSILSARENQVTEVCEHSLTEVALRDLNFLALPSREKAAAAAVASLSDAIRQRIAIISASEIDNPFRPQRHTNRSFHAI